MAKNRSNKKPKKPPTPPEPKPWDVPALPAKGDPEKGTLFAAVGSALSAWEGLEGRMAHIFENLVSPEGSSLAALRAYGSVLTFRGKGEMINAAANAAFFLSPNDQLEKDLKSLISEAGRFAARRNEIAHGRAGQHYARAPLFRVLAYPTGPLTVPAGYILGPPEYATNKTTLRPGRVLLETAYHAPAYAYSSVEILVFQSHFERLTEEARKLTFRLWQHQVKSQNT